MSSKNQGGWAMPDPTDAELDEIIGGAGTGGNTGNQVGRVFVIDDQGTLARLTWQPGTAAPSVTTPWTGRTTFPGGTPGRLVWANPDTGEVIGGFQPGMYRTQLDQMMELDATGGSFPSGTRTIPTGGGGGLGYGEQVGLIGVETEAQIRLAEARAEIDMQLWEAQRPGSMADQRALLNERERIDREAETRGYQFQAWMTVVDQHFQIRLRDMDQEDRIEIERMRQVWDAEQARLAQEFQTGEREAGQEFTAEQAELARQNQLRTQAIGELGGLRRQLVSAQQQANQWLAETLGKDPIRAATRLQGGVQVGRTPMQAYRGQLQRLASQQMPEVDVMGDVGELIAAVGGQQGRAQMPQAPRLGVPTAPVGMTGGGTVEMVRDAGGTFVINQDAATPDLTGATGIGIKVGERGEEIVHIKENPFSVEVIPVVARGQGGLKVERSRLGTRGLAAPARPQPRARLAAAPPPAPVVTPRVQVSEPAVTPTVARPTVEEIERPRTLAAPAAPRALVPQARAAGLGEARTPVSGPVTMDLPPTATPEALPFMTDLQSRWPNVSPEDAMNAQAYGLPEVSDAILRFTSDLMTEADAFAIIQGYMPTPSDLRDWIDDVYTQPGERPPPPAFPVRVDPKAEIDLLERIIAEWPNLTSQDALLADQLGLYDLGAIILEFSNGTITQQEAANRLRELIPGFPQVPTEAQGEFADLYDEASIAQAISQLWRHLELQTPWTEAGPLGGRQFQPGAPPAPGEPVFDWQDRQTPLPEMLGRLGVNQSLFRNSETGQVYVMGEDDMLHAVGPMGYASAAELAEMGITDPSQIVSVPPSVLNLFGDIGQPIQTGAPGFNITQVLPELGGPYPSLASPLIEPVTGLALPQPRAIANLINRLDPVTRDLIYSAYELAGVPLAAFERERRFFTPMGTGQAGGVRLG